MVLRNKSHVVCEAELTVSVHWEGPLQVLPAAAAGDIRDTDSESTVPPRTAEVAPS